MPYTAQTFKVMIASPSDVMPERAVTREVLAEWNAIYSEKQQIVLLPIMWETHSTPSMAEPAQAVINKYVLKDCDLLVGVFWTRIGTATADYVSGSVEEIEEHLKQGKQAMLYFSDAPVRPDSVDSAQYEALKKFKASCQSRGLYETYSDLNDFKAKFNRQLQLKINKEPYFAAKPTVTEIEAVQSSIPDVPSLSKEAQTLLLELAQDQSGMIFRVGTIGGPMIQTNGKGFAERGNPRSSAMWEGAIQELESEGLIAPKGHKGEAFAITREGYSLADVLKQ